MNNHDLLKNMAQLFLRQIREEKDLTPDDIRQQVDRALEMSGLQTPDNGTRQKLISELEAQYQTVIGTERELLGDDEGWSPWLPERRADISGKYWDRYKTYLSHKSFPDDVLARLDTSTERVLGLMGDPHRSGTWDRRGLVVGLVQSGKTAHYVGSINKAIDAGYKVVVVLTGFTESLRVQTQKRIEEGVIGFSHGPDPNDPKKTINTPCGVNFVDPNCTILDSVTNAHNDFKTSIAKNFAIRVGKDPIIFVIKKNASVLKNLLQWVNNFGTNKDEKGRTFVSQIPLLVIDDESDVGSVDTKKGSIDESGDHDPDHDPSKINKQIRKLLSLFEQSSYVGYTATPFANVLVHDGNEAEIDREDSLLIGQDLFPRSFIVSLPTPSNHVGPGVVFGSTTGSEEETRGLPIIRQVDDTELGEEKSDFWMPASHKKTHIPLFHGEKRIPDSLRKALHSFILVIAARRLRGDGEKHNSMLVHVTRFVDVQKEVFEQIERERQDIFNRLRNGTGDGPLLESLRDLWENDPDCFRNTTREIARRPDPLFQNLDHTWAEIRNELFESVSSLEVRTINGEAGDLDYEKYNKGLNVIAIGGDKLARGLTLEGLSVSYFLRCSKMYDTLMQMGRWFGYRPGYLDLCRLFTTSDLSEWFSHIAAATDELREEFNLMANSGRTPKDFGLKVLSHPTMLVTSAVKMRHGQKIQISFQGTMVQTIDFSRKSAAVEGNYQAAKSLIENAGKDPAVLLPTATGKQGKATWTNVPGNHIVEFLSGYQEHEAARTVRTQQLADYVEKQIKKGGLEFWTILVSGRSNSELVFDCGEIEVGCIGRAWNTSGTTQEELQTKDHYRIKVLTSPSDESDDLSQEQKDAALEADRQDWRNTNEMRRGKEVPLPQTPGGPFIRRARKRENGLLILYPLSPADGKAENTEFPVMGFAISFPAVEGLRDTTVSYIVSNIYQQQELNL